MTNIGVVTATFHEGDTVKRRLNALALARERLDADTELFTVIVENASHDGTIDRVREHAVRSTRDEL